MGSSKKQASLFFASFILTACGTHSPHRDTAALNTRVIPLSCAESAHEIASKSDENLFASVQMLLQGADPDFLSAKALEALSEYARPNAVGSFDTAQLEVALAKLSEKLGPERVESLVGRSLKHLRSPLRPSENQNLTNDLRDMNRGWGWKLLPEDDAAFSDPEFLARLLMDSRADHVGRSAPEPASKALNVFEREWKLTAPSNVAPPSYFTMSGSQANEAVYTIAASAVSKRSRRAVAEYDAEIITFKDMFVSSGAPGRLQHRSFTRLKGVLSEELKDLVFENPVTVFRNEMPPSEVERLDSLEASLLESLEKRIAVTERSGIQKPIGAVLIEPVLGAAGVKFYRTEFLLRLRALCDKYGVAIVADEVLTGGGRTGKFFSYEHYPNFEPDFVTFGKGLQVSGIAKVNRKNPIPFDVNFTGPVTNIQYSEPLLKSAAVLKRLREAHLMDNANDVGAYFVSRLMQRRGPRFPTRRNNEDFPRGIGLLIYQGGAFSELGLTGATGGRLMPYLTLSREQVDQIVSSRP